jgi:flagellar biosynthesis protein FlhF
LLAEGNRPMTRRLKAPQRRARRVARRNRDAEPRFDLLAVAARSADRSELPLRRWPGTDLAFIDAILEAHNVPMPLAKRLGAAAASLPLGSLLAERLSAALADQLHFAPLEELMRRPALLLVGPPGVGKTTMAAKLAAQLGEPNAMLVSADTARPGGIAQIEEYAGVLGLPVKAVTDAADLRQTLAAAARHAIIDTPGIAPGDTGARDRIAAIVAASDVAPLLVLGADCAAEEASAVIDFFAPLRPETLLPTRFDFVRRLGGILAAADAGRLALRAAGTTPHFAYGLSPLTPAAMARHLIDGALQKRRSCLPAA